MARIKKIDVDSFARFRRVSFTIIGLICGVLYGIGGLIYDVFTTGLNGGTALALMAILIMPAIAAVIGFVVGSLEAIVFNSVAKKIGGITVEIED